MTKNSDKNNNSKGKKTKSSPKQSDEVNPFDFIISEKIFENQGEEKTVEEEDDISDKEFLRKHIGKIPLLSPKKMVTELEKMGYRGQSNAKRSVTLLAYRHIQRLRRIYIENLSREKIGEKNNMLLMGPTGCGKTYLVESLFDKILDFPTVVVDVTPYSETGYVGQDPNNILTRLYHTADRDERLTRIGIIALDEFDKLASTQNNAVFAGAGTTKDITGLGVQRELLKMLETSEVNVPVELTHSSYVETININTQDIAFVGIGAFSGFSSILNRFAKGKVKGFGQEIKNRKRYDETAIAVDYDPEEVENISYFQSYGFLPELVARFGNIVPFASLDEDTMKDILEDNVLSRVRKEFELEKIKLVIKEDVIDHIVKLALNRETGARGLSSLIFRYLEEKAFELFGEKEGAILETYMDGDKISSRIK
ncbi:MAG: AAA family ATPase [Deltaproteobacteria bacterium]|jgi:ATP-dependent Clp protease ATP-binding subunit ClpX|nr:AAA family ATPase [Deltaproteobacteria bacterium]